MQPSDISGILTRLPPTGDVRIAYGEHPSQFGDLFLPPGPGPHPVVIALHGGFWRASVSLDTQAHVCGSLRARGIACWNVEFRRLGDGGGFPTTLEDVASAADRLRELAPRYSLDLGRVVSLGFSAGGQLALWLAARHKLPAASSLHSASPLPLLGAVSAAGAVDLVSCSKRRLSGGIVDTFVGGTPNDVPERYREASPAELLPLGVPQILAHGENDPSVPYGISEDYARRAREAGDRVEFLFFQNTGHYELLDPLTESWRDICEAIVALVGVSKII